MKVQIFKDVARAAPEHAGERFVQRRVGLHHVCLRARSREDVDRIHDFLREIGAEVVHPPEDGPFARLSKKPIEGAGTVDQASRYQFVDDTIEPGKVYFYYVESIAMSGKRERFTPVRRAKAKSAPAAP